jgi:hypothetical protein
LGPQPAQRRGSRLGAAAHTAGVVPRYGLRSDQARLPKDASKREALARQIGADGYQLLD